MQTLPSGITFQHIPWHDARCFITVFFGRGSTGEGDLPNGCAHFLEHMMFRGSKTYHTSHSLQMACDRVGGQFNAATSYDHTEFTYLGTSDRFFEALTLMADFLSEPKFLDIEREREIISREIEDELNEANQPSDLLHHYLAHIDQGPFSHSILGSLKSIKLISLSDLEAFRRLAYSAKNMSIVTISATPKEDVEKRIEALFSQYPLKDAPKSKPFPLQYQPKSRLVCIENSDLQYQVFMGFFCPSREPMKLAFLSHFLTGGFASSLTLPLREELGLVYDISSFVELFAQASIFSIEFSVTKKLLFQVLAELKTRLASLCEGEFSEESFSLAKNRYQFELMLETTSVEATAFAAAKSLWLAHTDELSLSFLTQLEAYSYQEFCHDIKGFLSKERVTIVLFGPKKSQVATMAEKSFFS